MRLPLVQLALTNERDEYGREAHWQARLGRRAVSLGADRTWELVVGS